MLSALRQFVATRANFRCEYCLKPDIAANFSFHLEHVIGRQHGGTDRVTNLAYSCSHCNWKKGPNISTVLSENGPVIRLFNPRIDRWSDHFFVEEGVIYSKTDIGEGTLRLLEFNALELILERKELMGAGLYP
jgi:HNH endonuclease